MSSLVTHSGACLPLSAINGQGSEQVKEADLIFSIEGVEKEYSLNVDDEGIKICSIGQDAVKYPFPQCHFAAQTYDFGGKFYFVLRSKKHTNCDSLFCFDPRKNNIECIWSKEKEYQFVKNRVIIFNGACNKRVCAPGQDIAVIRIIDLNLEKVSRVVVHRVLEEEETPVNCYVNRATNQVEVNGHIFIPIFGQDKAVK